LSFFLGVELNFGGHTLQPFGHWGKRGEESVVIFTGEHVAGVQVTGCRNVEGGEILCDFVGQIETLRRLDNLRCKGQRGRRCGQLQSRGPLVGSTSNPAVAREREAAFAQSLHGGDRQWFCGHSTWAGRDDGELALGQAGGGQHNGAAVRACVHGKGAIGHGGKGQRAGAAQGRGSQCQRHRRCGAGIGVCVCVCMCVCGERLAQAAVVLLHAKVVHGPLQLDGRVRDRQRTGAR
jgi:hypothetical protein